MEKSILSIQSHVSHGFVGNRAATFPLQILGWDVDVVNTVNFANHSGYRRRAGDGTKSTGEQLEVIFNGMNQNGLLEPSRLLTGYIPNGGCGAAVLNLARDLRGKTENLIYLLDPVLGDNGALYVAADMIPLYRALLSTATIITPNWFELETLVGFQLDSLSALRKALEMLHTEYRVPHVVISSLPITKQRATWLPTSLTSLSKPLTEGITWAEEGLLCIASSRLDSSSTSEVYTMAIPQIKGYFSGVGDLFSAMVLGHYYPEDRSTNPLARAVCNAVRTTHAILRKTAIASARVPGASRDGYTDDELDAADVDRRPRRMKARELRLIGSIDIISTAGKSALKEDDGFEQMQPWRDFWTG
ncbi:hypothetical protein M408DRAFT_60063 [Serendipita vermifera MAFF 305830]|uniref:pyridoxal kinase n=1 Tax=Serendipita vermifera MAFF 305830 TaxID=933852 RepID=A0A0C3BBC5_SERVB|nr:hypothetical protein M408DRAFT_60063 [Serendipita vermifera MAFF 305830]